MALRANVRVEGLQQVLKRLRQLPGKLQRRVLRSAVQKGATVVVKKARKLAPLGKGLTPDGRPRDHLRKTIVRTRAKFYPNTGTVLSVAGVEKGKSPHAHLVHDGTKPHAITLTQPLVLNNVVLPPGFVIDHPGSDANPYVDAAVRATRPQVLKTMEVSIVKGIEKETNKLNSGSKA